MANRWVRRHDDDQAEWHLLAKRWQAPRGEVLAACGHSLGDDMAKFEDDDGSLVGDRCAACQGVVLYWG